MELFSRELYHAQEHHSETSYLDFPLECKSEDAWLGNAYYFWWGLIQAKIWGNGEKDLTGFFDIYSAKIISENILDTVFSQEDYSFWVLCIDTFIDDFREKKGYKPKLKHASEFLRKEFWLKHEYDAILYQDLETFSPIKKFYYKKRIQLAVYNENIIKDFKLDFAKIKVTGGKNEKL